MNRKTPRPLTLDERLALNWFRRNSPGHMNSKGVPKSETRSFLMARGLIEISPRRKRFDPISYSITEEGIELLRGWDGLALTPRQTG